MALYLAALIMLIAGVANTEPVKEQEEISIQRFYRMDVGTCERKIEQSEACDNFFAKAGEDCTRWACQDCLAPMPDVPGTTLLGQLCVNTLTNKARVRVKLNKFSTIIDTEYDWKELFGNDHNTVYQGKLEVHINEHLPKDEETFKEAPTMEFHLRDVGQDLEEESAQACMVISKSVLGGLTSSDQEMGPCPGKFSTSPYSWYHSVPGLPYVVTMVSG